jgi:hypothetical protein
MKSFQDFKIELVEEEKSDYSKFDVLVRAGLANKAQMQRIHRILDKMNDERPNFNTADKQIIQNLFNKMVDLVSNNKQIFQQTRRAVREDIEEGVIATSDYKLGSNGQKVKAHRTKLGDTAPGVGGMAPEVGDDKEQDQNALKKTYKESTEVVIDEAHIQNPPFVLILKRKAVRYYPEGITNVLYYNEKLNRYFSVPYSSGVPMDNPVQAEEVEQVAETVDAIGQLQKIKDTHQHGTVNHKDGSASKVDAQTAHAVLTVHKSLNDVNKKKFADMVARSSHHMQKAADFSWKHLK